MRLIKTWWLLGTFWVLAAVLTALTFAQVPRIMNYQGMLADASGAPITDTTDSGSGCAGRVLGFFISDTDSNTLWTDTVCVPIVNGYFDVQLDLSTNGGDTLRFNLPYYIQIMVDHNDDGDLNDATDQILVPREKLAPVSYAYRAIYADTADYAPSGSQSAPSSCSDLPTFGGTISWTEVYVDTLPDTLSVAQYECISSPFPATTWHAAVHRCLSIGGRLCDQFEYIAYSRTTHESSKDFWVNMMRSTSNDAYYCRRDSCDALSSHSEEDYKHRYRCCVLEN